MRTRRLFTLVLVLSAPAAALAEETASACPPAVAAAVDKAYPGAKIASCRPEREEGEGESWDVLIVTKDQRWIELGFAADGKLLEVEEPIDLGAVPAVVLDAFSARYPKEKVGAAAREQEGGKTYYAITFGTHEAKFSEDGTFVEDEQEDD